MTTKKKTDAEGNAAQKTRVGFVSALVDKYGSVTVSIATLVIAIIFCMWFTTKQMNWMQHQFEKAQERNNIEMVQLIQSTVDESVKSALDQRDEDHNERARKRISIAPRVNADLKRGLVEIGTDDIMICEYHNGYTNIATNLPFCKYSVTYEVVRPGVTQVSQEFQGMSISPLITMLEPGKVSYFTREDTKDVDSYIYYFMTREKAREMYACPIVVDGNVCGVLVCVNVKNYNTDQQKIMKLSQEISTYLHIKE
jgi:hypothetical protein